MKIFPLFLSTEKDEFEKYIGKNINKNEYNNLINTVTSLTDNINNNPDIFKNLRNSTSTTFNSDNIVSDIDKYINSFSLDELLNKPSFFLDYNSKHDQRDHLYNLTDNKLDGAIMENNSNGRNIFNQKKIFYNLLTDFIASEKIYTDDKQDTIFLFQYLVNVFFNTFIKLYKDKNNYDDSDLFFIYKGGTVIQILYKKYIDLFDNADFLSAYDDNFKRSDSDYSIFINKKKFNDDNSYNKIFYDMNILTYNILEKIKDMLLDLKIGKQILPLHTITSDELKKKLDIINKTLRERKGELDFFDDVDEFIGLTLNDITYMAKSIPDNFNIHRIEDKYDKEDENNYNSLSKKEDVFYKNKKVSVNRQGFFVSTIEERGSSKTKIIMINDQAANIVSNGIYTYFNQTNRYTRSGSGNDYNDFTLHRMKINCILYYKTKADQTNGVKYGFINCPGELIDVPIAKFDDYKVDKQSEHVNKYYKNYLNENKIYSKKLSFKSYSLEGFIDDLLLTFTEVNLPWELDKYKKKLIRLTLLILLLLYNEYNKDYKENLIKFCEEYISYLSNSTTDYNFLLNYKINNKKQMKEDDLIKLYIDYFCLVKTKITNSKDKEEYDNMIKIIKDDFDKFIDYLKNHQGNIISNYNENNEKVPYLKKYLKYKNKYLKLKTNI
jgi:hypothetical protein